MRLFYKNGTTSTWSFVTRVHITPRPLPQSSPSPFNPDDNGLFTWEAALQSGSLALICLLALVGNFLVALTLIRKELLVFPSNRLVFNLTGANFAFSLLVLPFVVVSVAVQQWPFGIFWCNFTAFLTLLFGVASIATLAMIAVDRYVAIVKPLMYPFAITVSKSTAMLLWVWTQACVCSIPPLFGWSKYEYVEAISVCSVSWDNNAPYTMLLLTSCVLLPFIVMVTCYYFIFQVARAKCRKIHVGLMSEPLADGNCVRPQSCQPAPSLEAHSSAATKRPSWSLLPYNSVTKSVRTIGIVLGTFLLTWLPYVTMASSELTYGHIRVSRYWQVLATWLMYSSAVCYPLVYGVYNRSIRKEIRSCICRPGAKAKRGLPRRNSRRLSSSVGLFDYSVTRLHSFAKRSSTEFSRASIDLGSLSFFRSRMRKGSQDSGAVMTESDLDSDLQFVPFYWFGRRWASTSSRLDNISAKFHKLREKPYPTTASDIQVLPILRAISSGTEDSPCQEMTSIVPDLGLDRQDATDGMVNACSGPKFSEIPVLGERIISVAHESPEDGNQNRDEMLFVGRTLVISCGESVDEGISNDCILEDLE